MLFSNPYRLWVIPNFQTILYLLMLCRFLLSRHPLLSPRLPPTLSCPPLSPLLCLFFLLCLVLLCLLPSVSSSYSVSSSSSVAVLCIPILPQRLALLLPAVYGFFLVLPRLLSGLTEGRPDGLPTAAAPGAPQHGEGRAGALGPGLLRSRSPALGAHGRLPPSRATHPRLPQPQHGSGQCVRAGSTHPLQ